MNELTADYAASLLPPRPETAHKGSFGFAVCVAGSEGMCGAGALASLSALRAGCGRVTWIHPGRATARPAWEVMTLPLGGIAFSDEDAEAVVAYLERAQVLCIGPGLGRREETFAFVRRVLEKISIPFVLDADGLMAFSGCPERIPEGKRCILTPHEGEASALLGLPSAWVKDHREETVRLLAEKTGGVAVLKGHNTLICCGEEVWRNSTGNAGMATAGSGDVLTGLIGGLLAQGMPAKDAALSGVCLHGTAGDLAARSGSRGLIASDLIESARAVLASWDGESERV